MISHFSLANLSLSSSGSIEYDEEPGQELQDLHGVARALLLEPHGRRQEAFLQAYGRGLH